MAIDTGCLRPSGVVRTSTDGQGSRSHSGVSSNDSSAKTAPGRSSLRSSGERTLRTRQMPEMGPGTGAGVTDGAGGRGVDADVGLAATAAEASGAAAEAAGTALGAAGS